MGIEKRGTIRMRHEDVLMPSARAGGNILMPRFGGLAGSDHTRSGVMLCCNH
jgi:hypothetical protein